MTKYIWKYPRRNPESQLVDYGEQLCPQIKNILYSRGIQTQTAYAASKKPNIANLHDPFLMKDMAKAVDRVIEALETHQKILVYGDYDVDGTTAIALVYSFMRDRGADVDFYVPDRYLEGYGISHKGIDEAIANGVQLIITLDCGIKALDTIARAQEAGIDVIVCDHHNQGETLPNAYAVLDPKRRDCPYPFKELSGCGVGFKLLHAVCEKMGLSLKENLYCYLDYVAISTAADIVSMTGENRIYMQYGLIKMRTKPLMSVKTMLKASRLLTVEYDAAGNETIHCPSLLTVSDIVFKIAPKINAAGRMKTARDAIYLLIAADEQEAMQYFETVQKRNDSRKEEEQTICREALAMINEDPHASERATNVLFKSTWHKGVVGIAAAKIIESYYKPTIVLCGDGDIISGSARSVEGFDLYSSIEACSSLLTTFGGHTHAAGLSMKKENLEAFKQAFDDSVSAAIDASQKEPTICIDEELLLRDVTPCFYKQLLSISPFGPDNMDPIFLIRNVCPDRVFFMSNDEHVKFLFNVGATSISAIGFGMGSKWKSLEKTKGANTKIDICFTMGTNVYQGIVSLQLQLKDFRPITGLEG